MENNFELFSLKTIHLIEANLHTIMEVYMDSKFRKISKQIPILVAVLILLCLVLPFTIQAKSSTDTTVIKKENIISKEKNALKSTPMNKSAESGLLPKKVVKALEIIQNETDVKSMGQSIQRLKLNQKEKNILAREIKKNPYAEKLNRLAKNAQRKAESAMKAKAKIKIARYEKQAMQNNTRKVQSLNRQAMARLSTLKSGEREVRVNAVNTMTAVSWASLNSESRGPRVNIRSVSPRTVSVGGNVTIEGENFGTTSRNVYVILEEEGYECQVNSWSQTHINVTIPASLSDLVGETVANAFICVVMRDYIYPLRITPVQDMLQPQIADVSSHTITPGQTLIIEGDRFLTSSQGRVIFRFGDRSINAMIDEWTDDYVSVTLPESVEGLGPVTGIVKLINHARNEDSRSIEFEPVIETMLFESDNHDSGALIFGSRISWTDNDFTLINGWTVTRYWLEIEEVWVGGG